MALRDVFGENQPNAGAFLLRAERARRQLQVLLLEVWEANRRTVVMVTHDVDEAVLLSDRILVMSPGPDATIIEDLSVDIPRPRFDTGAGASDEAIERRKDELRHHLLGLLEH